MMIVGQTPTAMTHKPIARPGDAVWDVGRLGLECLLGDVTRREGALPTVGLQVRTSILHATSTRVPDTHSAVRWATNWHTGVRAVARDPACAKSRGLERMGHSRHSLRAGSGLRVGRSRQ